MRRMLLLVAVTGAGACAQAHQEGFNTRPDGGIHVTDSSDSNPSDAAPGDSAVLPDGPNQPAVVTLTYTMDNTVAANNSLACGSTGGTSQMSYYRVFPLSDFAINGPFVVSSVTFQVEYASSAPASTLKIGTYSGVTGTTTLTAADISVLQTASVAIPDADADDPPPMPGTVQAPITATVPAGSNLLVELDVPSSAGFFYIGTSTGGEREPGYASTTSTATACTPPGRTPTSMSSIAGGESDILMTVTGTAQ